MIKETAGFPAHITFTYMKLVTAIIRETQLDSVHEKLINSKIERITVSRVSGHGRQHKEEIYRGSKVKPTLIAKMKVEIAVNDKYLEPTIEALIKGAKTADSDEEGVGDGKIFVTELQECIRIRTGERGSDAI